MKILKFILLSVALVTALSVEGKTLKTSHLYMFGFSASFKDSVIYITDIQDIQGACINSKGHFLLGRDEYSRQLNTYLTDQMQQSGRICMVMFSPKKKKAEKQYQKLMKKYKRGYEVRYLSSPAFQFTVVDISPEGE